MGFQGGSRAVQCREKYYAKKVEKPIWITSFSSLEKDGRFSEISLAVILFLLLYLFNFIQRRGGSHFVKPGKREV